MISPQNTDLHNLNFGSGPPTGHFAGAGTLLNSNSRDDSLNNYNTVDSLANNRLNFQPQRATSNSSNQGARQTAGMAKFNTFGAKPSKTGRPATHDRTNLPR